MRFRLLLPAPCTGLAQAGLVALQSFAGVNIAWADTEAQPTLGTDDLSSRSVSSGDVRQMHHWTF
eukprot:1260497-Amphidinium_carterae.3